jgi:hypothetical protein
MHGQRDAYSSENQLNYCGVRNGDTTTTTNYYYYHYYYYNYNCVMGYGIWSYNVYCSVLARGED